MSKLNWSSIQLYFSGDDYFNAAIHAIESAQKEVLIESYIFDFDPIGIRFLEALKQAKMRNVYVQILIDGVGSFNSINFLKSYCLDNKIPLRIYHPLPLYNTALSNLSWKTIRRLLLFFRTFNKRNHRKVILVDQKIAFLGSFNISQVHSQKYLGSHAWRDTGICIHGNPIVTSKLYKALTKTWRRTKRGLHFTRELLSKRGKIKQRVSESIRLNSSARWRFFLLRDLNKRMKLAKDRILITNAYFIPRKSVLRNLRRAAKRGVYVALCLPSKTDVAIVRLASRSLYYRLMKSGVHIFEYQPSVLHAKTLIIDNWSTVGSHNLNHRSIVHDLEVEAVLDQENFVQQLYHQWEKDIENSKEIHMNDLGKWGLVEKMLGRIFYWFRYWL